MTYSKGYYFFETPDYDDCARKAMYCVKIGTVAGTFLGAHELFFNSIGKPPTTFSFKAFRILTLAGIPASVGFMGSTMTCAISNLRGKKDDCWNYFWGFGPVSALVYSAFLRNSGKGCGVGLYLGTFAALIKKGHVEDWVIWADMLPFQSQSSGSMAGDSWGDWRHISPVEWRDPGRRQG